MNAREHEYRLSLELRQVNDVLSCLLHSLLLHRTSGKFNYTDDQVYSLGTIGLAEVDCDYVDLSYVRVNSDELFQKVEENIQTFKTDIETNALATPRRTPMSSPVESAVPFLVTKFGIEFYQIKRRSWPMSSEQNTWERWNIILDIFKVASLDEFTRMKESVAETLSDIVLSICSSINRPQYLPKLPSRVELNEVFDTNFSDCQPYLFKFSRPTTKGTSHLSPLNKGFRLLKDFAT